MKKILTLVLCAALVVSIAASGEQPVRVTIDGREVVFPDQQPVIENGRVLVPIRFVSEELGMNVEWDDETRTVVITTEDQKEKPFELALSDCMPDGQNYMYSPLSIKMALLLAANGATGETQSEILKTIGVSSLDEANEWAKALIERFNSNEDATVEIANSVWLNADVSTGDFSDDYKAAVEKYYAAAAEKVNARNAVSRVNSWVSEKTRGKIGGIISDGDFLACLVNATYFFSNWRTVFDEEDTYKEQFTCENGEVKEIDFMHDTRKTPYFEDGENKMLALPYKGGFTMYVTLGDVDLDAARDKMSYEKVSISLPKWKAEFSTSLTSTLKKMGITKAFTADAELGKMFEQDGAKIDDVLHKTFIEVDERGTEAAAVTAIAVGATALAQPERVYSFKADHPFKYYICDDESGEILFAGYYGYAQ